MIASPHILIAEDDLEDRFILSESFHELGHSDLIEQVEDGMQLIEYLDAKGVGEVSLIVLDLNMPRLNGTETLRVLKSDEKYRQIPVIIFSTSVNHIEKDICMELGAREYISKPPKYIEFLDTCKRMYEMSLGSA